MGKKPLLKIAGVFLLVSVLYVQKRPGVSEPSKPLLRYELHRAEPLEKSVGDSAEILAPAESPAENSAPKDISVPRSKENSSGQNKSMGALIQKLDELKNCRDRDCGFPQTDPRSYEFALGRAQKALIDEMSAEVRAQNIQSTEAAGIAREYLESDDGHVKEAALRLMATQYPDPKNLQTILDEIILYHDAELIDEAMHELKRYTDEPSLRKIDDALAEAMLTGSPFVALAISERIHPFINSTSVRTFQEVIKKLGMDSSVALNLKNSISRKYL